MRRGSGVCRLEGSMKGAMRLLVIGILVAVAACFSYSAAFAGDDVVLGNRRHGDQAGSHCEGNCKPCDKCEKCCPDEEVCLECVDQCGNEIPLTEGDCITPPVANQGCWDLQDCCCPPEQYTLCTNRAQYHFCGAREEFQLLCCAKKCCEDKCGCEKKKKCGCEDQCGCEKCSKHKMAHDDWDER